MASTSAEKIVAGDKKVSKEIEAAGEKAQETAAGNAKAIREQLRFGGLRDQMHAESLREELDSGNNSDLISKYESGEITTANLSEHSGLSREEAQEKAQEFADDWLENSTYAYSFHVLDDESVLAVYVLKEGGKVQYAAFEDWDATRGWHPVRAPKE